MRTGGSETGYRCLNYADPFGLKVEVKGSREFKAFIQALIQSDSAFRDNYTALDSVKAVYFVVQSPTENSITWGGTTDGTDESAMFATPNARQYGYSGEVRGLIRIGGDGPWSCTIPHEFVHARGIERTGSKTPGSHADFFTPYFAANKCLQHPRR